MLKCISKTITTNSAALLAALLLFISCSTFASERADKGWQLISEGALVIDVRTPQEFSAGHLDDALNYPLSELDRHVADLDKSQLIVVYCRSGARSGRAYEYLLSQGFTRIHNAGGLEEMLAAE